MPEYQLIKNGVVVNTIIAHEVDSIKSQYDSIVEVVPVTTAPTPLPPHISVQTIRNNLTLAEKVKWDNDSTPNIVTAKIEFQTPLLVSAANTVLEFLVSTGDISQTSVNNIIAAAS